MTHDGRDRLWRPRAALCALAALAACGGERREITEQRTYRPVGGGIRWDAPVAERFGGLFEPLPQATPPPAASFTWELPDGWREGQPSQFRQADFRIDGKPGIECYLSLVAGGALANVNRWRGQMGLGSLSPDEVQALPKLPFLGLADRALYLELEGTYSGMGGVPQPDHLLAALVLEAPQGTVTLKLIGPAAAAREELDAFKALAASFRLEGGPETVPPDPAGTPAADGGSPALSWQAPAGWRPQPARMMTEVVYGIGEGSSCWVSVLGSDGGGTEANIQRWRGEMGGAPVAERTAIAMFGTQGTQIRIDGDFGGNSFVPAIPGAAMLAVTCGLGGRTVFVKMVGPRDEVLARRSEFEAFCASLAD